MRSRVTRALLFFLLLDFAVPASARERPRADFYDYHVRVALGGEVLLDRDMIRAGGSLGEVYRRNWTAFVRDDCAGGDGAGISTTRNVSVRLGAPPAPVRDRAYPRHAFQLVVEASLPPTLRGRDGGCVHYPTANWLSLSQFVNLDRGQSIRIEREQGLIVEVSRP